MTLLKFDLGAAFDTTVSALELPRAFRLSPADISFAESLDDSLDPALPSGPIGLKTGLSSTSTVRMTCEPGPLKPDECIPLPTSATELATECDLTTASWSTAPGVLDRGAAAAELLPPRGLSVSDAHGGIVASDLFDRTSSAFTSFTCFAFFGPASFVTSLVASRSFEPAASFSPPASSATFLASALAALLC